MSETDYSKFPPLAPTPTPWCETPPPFEIRIGLPGWLSGVSGDIGVKGVVTNIDLSFDQLFAHLTHVPISWPSLSPMGVLRRWSVRRRRRFGYAAWLAFYRRQPPSDIGVCRRIRRLSVDQLR